ncbi:MAG: SipW-dependent-type signal peptide-containing protein [Bifidobacteriaceae bacterium]|jgi:predicted ribosomally synthesized peptide with SipW-like signal peptide|nr:SipW-dependent-type signal peptide-containing protein [Bifidobacteriaceae bacterium]
MENIPNTVVMVTEQPRRRRFAGVIGCIALGAALVAGTTLAAFTDRESARFGDDKGIRTANHNIQIRQTPANPSDTTAPWFDTDADNYGEDPDKASALVLDLTGGPLLPGDTTHRYKAAFQVRNAPGSQDTDLKIHFENAVAAGQPGYVDGDLAKWLTISAFWTPDTYWFDRTSSFQSFDSFAEAETVGVKVKAGTVYRVEVYVSLDAAADSSVANREIALKAVVTGQAV